MSLSLSMQMQYRSQWLFRYSKRFLLQTHSKQFQDGHACYRLSQPLLQTAGSNKELSYYRITCAVDTLPIDERWRQWRYLISCQPPALAGLSFAAMKRFPPPQCQLCDVLHLYYIRHSTFCGQRHRLNIFLVASCYSSVLAIRLRPLHAVLLRVHSRSTPLRLRFIKLQYRLIR